MRLSRPLKNPPPRKCKKKGRSRQEEIDNNKHRITTLQGIVKGKRRRGRNGRQQKGLHNRPSGQGTMKEKRDRHTKKKLNATSRVAQSSFRAKYNDREDEASLKIGRSIFRARQWTVMKTRQTETERRATPRNGHSSSRAR